MTLVTITQDDREYNDYKQGETGRIDGYVRGADDKPYAVVIMDKDGRVVLVDTRHVTALTRA